MMYTLMIIIFLPVQHITGQLIICSFTLSLSSLHVPQYNSWLTKCLIVGAVVTTSLHLLKTKRNLLLLAIVSKITLFIRKYFACFPWKGGVGDIAPKAELGREAWKATVRGLQRVRDDWAIKTHTHTGKTGTCVQHSVLNWMMQVCMGDTTNSYKPEVAIELSSPDSNASDIVFQSAWWFRYMCINVCLCIFHCTKDLNQFTRRLIEQ